MHFHADRFAGNYRRSDGTGGAGGAGNLKEISVEKQAWEILRYKLASDEAKIETETIGSFKQYPLRLAWAMTIHKSQGKTFDKVIIDLTGGAFEP